MTREAPACDWVEVSTIGDLLVRGAALWPEKEAVVFPGERRTYAALLAGAELPARALLGGPAPPPPSRGARPPAPPPPPVPQYHFPPSLPPPRARLCPDRRLRRAAQ